MKPKTKVPGGAEREPARRESPWPVHHQVMSHRSIASRKRAAAARLQARASVLLAEATDLDGRADKLLARDQGR